MKLNKIVFPIALALVAVLATSGCKKGYSGKPTPLPGSRQVGPGDTNGLTTLPQGGQVNPGDGVTPTPANIGDKTPPGGGPTAPFDLANYNPDPAALAAYTVHFKFDSAVVQDSEQANVASVASTLTANKNDMLQIEGHCDQRGTEQYNMSLGERRALALREALAKAGIDPMRIRTISYGKDKPEDPADNEAAWAKNRRGVFILEHPKTALP